jgi:hypothetical protein
MKEDLLNIILLINKPATSELTSEQTVKQACKPTKNYNPVLPDNGNNS